MRKVVSRRQAVGVFHIVAAWLTAARARRVMAQSDSAAASDNPLNASSPAEHLMNVEMLSVLDFGADPGGHSDSSAAVEAAIKSASRRAGWPCVIHFPPGAYVITRTIFVPDRVFLRGAGRNTRLVPRNPANIQADDAAFGANVDGFMFIKNSADGKTWAKPYPGEDPPWISGFWFDNIAAWDSKGPSRFCCQHMRGIRAFGGYEHSYLLFTGFVKAIERPAKAADEYMDQFSINRCSFVNQSRNEHGEYEYQVDVRGIGDGVRIADCNFPNNSVGRSLNGGTLAIRVDGNMLSTSMTIGATIENCIGGDIRINLCPKARIMLTHSEHTQIVVDRSNVEIEGGILFARAVDGKNNRTSIITLANDSAEAPDANSYVLSMRNVSFLWGFGAWRYDGFELLAHPAFRIIVDNCYRLFKSAGGISTHVGIRVSTARSAADGKRLSHEEPLADWNDYSHLLSRRGIIEADNLVPLDAVAQVMRGAPHIQEIMKERNGVAGESWQAGPGRYHYAIQLLWDVRRKIGQEDLRGQDGNSTSILIEPDEIGLVSARLILSRDTVRAGPVVLRVYRGPQVGMFTHFADVPLLSVGYHLVDDGQFISSIGWNSRPAGPPDPISQVGTASMRWTGRSIDFRGEAGPALRSLGYWMPEDNLSVAPIP